MIGSYQPLRPAGEAAGARTVPARPRIRTTGDARRRVIARSGSDTPSPHAQPEVPLREAASPPAGPGAPAPPSAASPSRALSTARRHTVLTQIVMSSNQA